MSNDKESFVRVSAPDATIQTLNSVPGEYKRGKKKGKIEGKKVFAEEQKIFQPRTFETRDKKKVCLDCYNYTGSSLFLVGCI